MAIALSRQACAMLGALALLAGAGCTSSPAPAPSTDQAALAAFLGSSFGGVTAATLRTNALPYKVVATALVLDEERRTGRSVARTSLPALYRRFGFLTPERIAGWPAHEPRPQHETPVGLVRATVAGPVPGMRVDGVGIGCAACHAGVAYDAQGAPLPATLVPGLPNTSVDVEGYATAVYRAMQATTGDAGAFRARLLALFPETGIRERLTLRWILQPAVRKQLRALAAAGDRATPFSNGGPGRTNGVASLHRTLGLAVDSTAVGFTSIPDLSHRALRSSLLYDGVYAPPGAQRFAPRSRATPAHVDSLGAIVAFFTVPTLGLSPQRAIDQVGPVQPVFRWLAYQYRAPAFPGPIDGPLAARGEAVYLRSCASCHGRYAPGSAAPDGPLALVEYPNRLVPQAEIGTDPARWMLIDSGAVRAIARSAFGRHVSAERTGGYVAPILSGVWATAPYLHNGSVPTIAALLEPSSRPVEFVVGGHRLDFERMGIALVAGVDGRLAYPAGHVPWATPQPYDTRRPGLSNAGHRTGAELDGDARRALIEYLKRL